MRCPKCYRDHDEDMLKFKVGELPGCMFSKGTYFWCSHCGRVFKLLLHNMHITDILGNCIRDMFVQGLEDTSVFFVSAEELARCARLNDYSQEEIKLSRFVIGAH